MLEVKRLWENTCFTLGSKCRWFLWATRDPPPASPHSRIPVRCGRNSPRPRHQGPLKSTLLSPLGAWHRQLSALISGDHAFQSSMPSFNTGDLGAGSTTPDHGDGASRRGRGGPGRLLGECQVRHAFPGGSLLIQTA